MNVSFPRAVPWAGMCKPYWLRGKTPVAGSQDDFAAAAAGQHAGASRRVEFAFDRCRISTVAGIAASGEQRLDLEREEPFAEGDLRISAAGRRRESWEAEPQDQSCAVKRGHAIEVPRESAGASQVSLGTLCAG